MDRHGAILTNEEQKDISRGLLQAIGDQKEGTADCDVFAREGKLKFQARVFCPNLTIVTVMTWGHKSPVKKTWRKTKQASTQMYEKFQRDHRRMLARK